MPIVIYRSIILVFALGAGIFVGRFYRERFGPKTGNFILPEGVALISSDQITGEAATPRLKNSKTSSNRTPSGEKLNSYAKNLYQTIGDDKRLTWGIRDLAGLSDGTASLIQEKIDSAYLIFDQEAKERLSYSQADSDPPSGKFVYRLAPFPEAAKQVWENLKSEIKNIAGPQASELLISAFHEDQKFGSLGKYQYKFIIDKQENTYRVEGVDPATNKIRDDGGNTIEKMSPWLRGLIPDN